MAKNLPVMQETWIRFLGWEDPLGRGMVTLKHSSSVGQQHQSCLGSGMGLEWALTMRAEKPRTPRSEVSIAAPVYTQGWSWEGGGLTLFCTPAPTPPNGGP